MLQELNFESFHKHDLTNTLRAPQTSTRASGMCCPSKVRILAVLSNQASEAQVMVMVFCIMGIMSAKSMKK